MNLLDYVAQYAIAGDIRAWVINDGTVVEQRNIEPEGDKSVIQAFMQGRALVKESGQEEEAIKALNRAIDKFERHGMAYERRGYINVKLRNFDDALYDFTKSIDIHPNNPEAYWGRAVVRIRKKDLAGAIEDLTRTTKTSIPHQPIYWSARRLKGELHLQLKEYQKAIFELKMVSRRPFKENDPNYKWQKNALFNYGKALFEIGEFSEAVNVFNQMFAFDAERSETPALAEQYFNRALARQKAGETGYVTDLKEAADRGSKKAAELLEEVAA